MKAAVLLAHEQPLEYADVPEPRIEAPTDVIVRIAAAGVCGSDIHVTRGRKVGPIRKPDFPYVIGHENAGWVEAVGDSVTALAPGDPVLLHPKVSCGLCLMCRRGAETHCLAARFPGVDGTTPGGYAEYMRTDVRAVLKLPPGTDPIPLAPLADAGLSAYHAVRKAAAALPPDGTAVVIGVGGLGYFAVQLLRAFSPARIVAADLTAPRLRLAEELGADVALESDGDLADRVRELTGGLGAEVVVDCVATGSTPEQGLAMLAPLGRYVALGSEDGEICCRAVVATGRELAIEGSLVGTFAELRELVSMTLRDRVKLVQTYYPLAEAAAALDDLLHGRVEGRAVLLPAVT